MPGSGALVVAGRAGSVDAVAEHFAVAELLQDLAVPSRVYRRRRHQNRDILSCGDAIAVECSSA